MVTLPLLWQVQGRVYLSSLLLVNKLSKKISNLHFCTVFDVDFLKQWSSKPAGVRDYQHCLPTPKNKCYFPSHPIFKHIAINEYLEMSVCHRCYHSHQVGSCRAKLQHHFMFLSARARAVRRCCWKRFVLIALSYLPPDKCCWIAFNNRHISFEWKKRCCFYFSVSCLNNLLTHLVNKHIIGRSRKG